MRNSIFAFAAALMIAGCGSNPVTLDGGNKDGGAGDMPSSGGDMTMTVTATDSCYAYLICLNNAGASTTKAAACKKKATATAQSLFGTLDMCITNQCTPGTDAGTGPCATPGDCNSCVQSGDGTTQM